MSKIDKLLTKRVEKIYPSKKALEEVLRSGKKLRVYLGVDPTGYRLHLGHSIPLTKLAEFADLGHEAILLFGTGTVLVGDPSQRGKARKKITEEEIEKNIATWKEQVKKIIDFKKVKVKKNADWLLKLTLPEIINITSKISSVQLFKRDMLQRRIAQGDTVWTHETLYPLLQGYDSVVMNVDLEIGGTDQTFNMLIGRELMQKMKHKEKFVLTTPMILGTDGKQMSKTSGNCIWLTDKPEEMFGKIMSLPDKLIDSYFELLTELNLKNLKIKNPASMDLKKRLALEIVHRFHNTAAAKKAQRHFEKVVQKKELPEKIPTKMVPWANGSMVNIIDLLLEVGLVGSRSEAKRLLNQGAVEVDDVQIKDNRKQITVKDGIIIKVGKRRFLKLKISNS